jgi:hypothetical protein
MSHLTPEETQAQPRWHPVLVALALIGGVILLLPGLCSIGFAIGFMNSGEFLTPVASWIAMLWVACFAIGWGGILLIRTALRRRKARDDVRRVFE